MQAIMGVGNVPAGYRYGLPKDANQRRHYPKHSGAGKDEWKAMSWHQTEYLKSLEDHENTIENMAKMSQHQSNLAQNQYRMKHENQRQEVRKREDQDIKLYWDEVRRQDVRKQQSRDNQWKSAFNQNTQNQELKGQKKNKIDALDKFEEQETLNYDQMMKERQDYREYLRRKEQEATAQMNLSAVGFKKARDVRSQGRDVVANSVTLDYPDPFLKNQADYRKYLADIDGQQEARKRLYERNVLPKLPGSPHTKDSLLDQKASTYSRDKFAVAQLPLDGDD